jgi:hypothetical protein
MSKHELKAALLVAVAAVVGQPAQVMGQQESSASPSGGQAVRECAFDKDGSESRQIPKEEVDLLTLAWVRSARLPRKA